MTIGIRGIAAAQQRLSSRAVSHLKLLDSARQAKLQGASFSMRRRTQKRVVNSTLFGCVLLLILYLNHAPGEQGIFAWTTVRYESTSASLPPAHGTCPGLASTSKPALVVSHSAAGDTAWLDALSPLYHLCIYTTDASRSTQPNHLRLPADRGHEAMTYLTFLIDNHAALPPAGAVFIHGGRWAWYNDARNYDGAALLSALNVTAALEHHGYHNLRCDWSASMCDPAESRPQGSLETSVIALFEPWNARAVSDAALPRALATLFGDEGGPVEGAGRVLLGRSEAVRAQCCAQFVVSRERMRQHSRDEYVALRQWLLDGEGAAPKDDRVVGRIMAYVWHILFMPYAESDVPVGEPGTRLGVHLDSLNAHACPRAEDCYCRLYGRCGLRGCKHPGHCDGEYSVPPGFKLPANWAAMHS